MYVYVFLCVMLSALYSLGRSKALNSSFGLQKQFRDFGIKNFENLSISRKSGN